MPPPPPSRRAASSSSRTTPSSRGIVSPSPSPPSPSPSPSSVPSSVPIAKGLRNKYMAVHQNGTSMWDTIPDGDGDGDGDGDDDGDNNDDNAQGNHDSSPPMTESPFISASASSSSSSSSTTTTSTSPGRSAALNPLPRLTSTLRNISLQQQNSYHHHQSPPPHKKEHDVVVGHGNFSKHKVEVDEEDDGLHGHNRLNNVISVSNNTVHLDTPRNREKSSSLMHIEEKQPDPPSTLNSTSTSNKRMSAPQLAAYSSKKSLSPQRSSFNSTSLVRAKSPARVSSPPHKNPSPPRTSSVNAASRPFMGDSLTFHAYQQSLLNAQSPFSNLPSAPPVYVGSERVGGLLRRSTMEIYDCTLAEKERRAKEARRREAQRRKEQQLIAEMRIREELQKEKWKQEELARQQEKARAEQRRKEEAERARQNYAAAQKAKQVSDKEAERLRAAEEKRRAEEEKKRVAEEKRRAAEQERQAQLSALHSFFTSTFCRLLAPSLSASLTPSTPWLAAFLQRSVDNQIAFNTLLPLLSSLDAAGVVAQSNKELESAVFDKIKVQQTVKKLDEAGPPQIQNNKKKGEDNKNDLPKPKPLQWRDLLPSPQLSSSTLLKSRLSPDPHDFINIQGGIHKFTRVAVALHSKIVQFNELNASNPPAETEAKDIATAAAELEREVTEIRAKEEEGKVKAKEREAEMIAQADQDDMEFIKSQASTLYHSTIAALSQSSKRHEVAAESRYFEAVQSAKAKRQAAETPLRQKREQLGVELKESKAVVQEAHKELMRMIKDAEMRERARVEERNRKKREREERKKRDANVTEPLSPVHALPPVTKDQPEAIENDVALAAATLVAHQEEDKFKPLPTVPVPSPPSSSRAQLQVAVPENKRPLSAKYRGKTAEEEKQTPTPALPPDAPPNAIVPSFPIHIMSPLVQEDSPRSAEIHEKCLAEMKKYNWHDALVLATEELDRREEKYKTSLDQRLLPVLDCISTCLEVLQKPDQALPFLFQFLQIFENFYGMVQLPVADTLMRMGDALVALKEGEDAFNVFARCYCIRKQLLGAQHPDTERAKQCVLFLTTPNLDLESLKLADIPLLFGEELTAGSREIPKEPLPPPPMIKITE